MITALMIQKTAGKKAMSTTAVAGRSSSSNATVLVTRRRPKQPAAMPTVSRRGESNTNRIRFMATSNHIHTFLREATAPGASAASSSLSSLVSVRHLSSSRTEEYPPHTLFPMPALSPTMVTGSIASWSRAEGDAFGAGDALCTIETDKAAVDFEAQDDGILAKILVPPGHDVPIGTPICIVTDELADVPAFANYPTYTSTATATSVADTSSTTTSDSTSIAPSPPPPSRLMPSARHLAESHGKDATVLNGSGKGGRVTKGDVLLALHSLPNLVTVAAVVDSSRSSNQATMTPLPAAATALLPTTTAPAAAATSTVTSTLPLLDLPVPPLDAVVGTYADVLNNKMRKIIASRLTASKRDVPHCYASVDIALDNLLALRKVWQKQHSVKISVNDFILRCCALSLRDVPEVNGTYQLDTGTVHYHDTIDVSVAVATPTGLITPILFHTDRMGLSDIAHTLTDLATRARQGKLAPHEYQGGTFSVSNLGMFGVSEFSAVINPPQAGTLLVWRPSKLYYLVRL